MRMVRHKRLLIAGTGVAAIAAVAVPVSISLADTHDGDTNKPTATAGCEVEALKDDKSGGISHVSDSGEYLAGFHKTDDGPVPVVWHDGKATELEDGFTINDINSSGAVVGDKYNAETKEYEAWLWQEGEYTQLTAPNPDGGVLAVGINDDGVIAGNTGLTHLDDEVFADIPLRWQAGATEAEELTVEDGLVGMTADIGADGTVVGRQTQDHQSGPWRPWAWSPDNVGTELKVPGEDVSAMPEAVRGEWVISRDFRWDVSEPDKPVENAMSYPTDIDDQGRVYGEEWDVDDVGHPAIEVDGEVTILPGLGDEPDEETSGSVTGANADGTLLAGKSGDQLAIWRCG